MATQRYRCKLPNEDEVTFIVDDAVFTDEEAGFVNSFWSGAEDRLAEANGDVKVAVLRLAALTVLALMRQSSCEYISDDDAEMWNEDFQEEEGWCYCGITIEEANRTTYETNDVEVEAL